MGRCFKEITTRILEVLTCFKEMKLSAINRKGDLAATGQCETPWAVLIQQNCAKFPSAPQHNPINGANKTPAILKPVADRFPFNASSCLVFLLLNVSFISFSSSFPSFLINIDLLSLKLHFISEFLNNDYAFSVHLKLNVFIQIQSFGRFGNSLHNECRFPPTPLSAPSEA